MNHTPVPILQSCGYLQQFLHHVAMGIAKFVEIQFYLQEY